MRPGLTRSSFFIPGVMPNQSFANIIGLTDVIAIVGDGIQNINVKHNDIIKKSLAKQGF